MVLLESGENLKEKQTADIRKKFGETIDLFRNLRKFFDNLRENYWSKPNWKQVYLCYVN